MTVKHINNTLPAFDEIEGIVESGAAGAPG